MKCSICDKEDKHKKYRLKEMMFGLRDEFDYFECSGCGCFQIDKIPENIDKYYPKEYYSFNSEKPGNVKQSNFKRLQYNQISGYNKSILGAIVSFKYKSNIYNWFKILNIDKKDKILDIGCGDGKLLVKLYQAGFQNLTGVDPYIREDIIYNEKLKVLKKDILDVEEKFDLIMMHHSLEHIPNQLEVLKKVYELLNDEGKLLIRIPVMCKPLFLKYGTDLVSLDPPRHFFIHSIKSITLLLNKAGFKIYKKEYDAEAFEYIASEQYQKGISIHAPNSYFSNPKNSQFTKENILQFKNQINALNAEEKSSSAVLYIKKIN